MSQLSMLEVTFLEGGELDAARAALEESLALARELGERRAMAQLKRGTSNCGPRAYDWLREAMEWYERAEAIRPPGNDDALLRWNTCARLIMRDRRLVPQPEERSEPLLLE